jgi:S-DNA-T family DNA segregation ATPase FtsK/SpoIIIE
MWVIRDGREILDPMAAPRRVWPAARLLPPPPESPGDPPEIPSLPPPPEPSPWWLQAPWLLTAAVYGLLGPLAFGGRGWIYLLALPATLLSSFLGTALQHRWAMRQHQRRVRETLETARHRLTRFLEAVERYRAAAEAREQALFPSWEAMRARAQMGSDLWFRRPEDPDFLHVRVGRTRVPLLPSSLPSSAGRWPDPEEAPEPLRPSIQALHGLLRGRREAPLTVSLRAPWVWRAFPGQEGALFRIFLEAAIAHSPADLFLMAALADPRWAFLRWLPHIGEEREGWADGPAAVRERIFEALYRRRGQGDPGRTAWLALLDEHALADPRLGLLLSEGPRLGLFPQLILPWGAPTPAGVAGEILLLPDGEVKILRRDGERMEGTDPGPLLSPEEAEAVARSLADLRPQTAAAVPRAVSGPALWGISGMEIVRPASPPPPSLAVPIGVADDGEPFPLDLSDRAHGPHAMVIGATGSGKSEALRTLALALALHFPPERVQLLFIDFKGGGAFAPLEGLPHCVGLLSNLDAREAARALRTLEGELDRRQRVLAARGADHADQIGLPHLVVMADEFAEMLEAIPDGMARMIRLARLGRSLGMHLVLATQRLGSAVPADLRANLRVRIALRCETPDESAAVIGRPDAAYLVGSGWAFVQVGQNEVFRRIRVAYVSGRSLGAREILWMDPADPARRLRREVIGGEARRDLDVLVEASPGWTLRPRGGRPRRCRPIRASRRGRGSMGSGSGWRTTRRSARSAGSSSPPRRRTGGWWGRRGRGRRRP